MEISTATMENNRENPQKTKSRTTVQFAIPLLGIEPEEMKSVCKRDPCTPMFLVALFTIAMIWDQPVRPSVDEWKKKMWYICIVDLLVSFHVCVCVCLCVFHFPLFIYLFFFVYM